MRAKSAAQVTVATSAGKESACCSAQLSKVADGKDKAASGPRSKPTAAHSHKETTEHIKLGGEPRATDFPLGHSSKCVAEKRKGHSKDTSQLHIEESDETT